MYVIHPLVQQVWPLHHRWNPHRPALTAFGLVMEAAEIFGNLGSKMKRTVAIALRQPGWLVPDTGAGLMGAGPRTTLTKANKRRLLAFPVRAITGAARNARPHATYQ